MSRLGDRSLSRLLDDVAAGTPAPAGGSSSAVACALAAALVEMTAGFADARVEAERARELRARALELAQLELASYEPVLTAQRRPPGDPARGERLARALEEASATPLEIAEAAAEVARLGTAVAAASRPGLRGDAAAGAVLAEAAATAACALVEINLRERGEQEPVARARQARDRAGAARDEALAVTARS